MFLSRGAGLENVRNVCAKRISAGFSPHLLGGSGGHAPPANLDALRLVLVRSEPITTAFY